MRLIRLLFVCLLLVSKATLAAERPITLQYKSQPLKITLAVGVEKQITFAAPVWAEIPNKLKSKLKTIIVGNNVYFTPIKSFKSERIIIGEELSNQVYLFDIRSGEKGDSSLRGHKDITARFLIENVGDRYDPATVEKELKNANSLNPFGGVKPIGYTSLIKFAARELYAPDRLRGGIPGISRATLPKTRVHHLVRGHTVKTKVIASWRGGNYYVTAIHISNMNKVPIVLDPRDVRGGFKAVAFQHNKLGSKGSDSDTSALYLVSDRPFYEIIRGTAIDVRN